MKSLAKNLALFTFLAIIFSALVGCGGAANNTNSANASNGSKKSDYPPVPAAIMQAEMKGMEGAKFKLEDYKGKVVLVNLWATWCGPCRSEMPHLIELQNAHKDKGFELIGLDVEPEDTEQMVKDFAAEMKLNYTLGWIEQKEYSEFLRLSKFNGIPQSFLINREGQLLGIFTGGSPSTIIKLKENVAKAVGE